MLPSIRALFTVANCVKSRISRIIYGSSRGNFKRSREGGKGSGGGGGSNQNYQSRGGGNARGSQVAGSAPMDHYQLLGVQRSATKSEIKDAFRRLAILFHPDKHTMSPAHVREAASLRFKQISDAYQVLVDDRKRADYDARISGTSKSSSSASSSPAKSSSAYSSAARSSAYSSAARYSAYSSAEKKPRSGNGEKMSELELAVAVAILGVLLGLLSAIAELKKKKSTN